MNRLVRLIRFGGMSSVGYVAGMTMLLTMVFIYCIANFEFLVGKAVSWWIVVLGFVLAEYVLLRNCTRKCFILSTGINIVVWIISLLVCSYIYDYSCDGIGYHQITIYFFADGWNPVWGGYDTTHLSLWSKHYAKALELISACIFKLTGDLETGKAVNLLLASATFFICFCWLNTLKPEMSRRNRLILSLLVIGNPIWICQALTYYIDYALYFYLILTIVFSVEICRNRNLVINYLGLSGVIILAIGTKFNHFFIEGIAVLAILVWGFFSGQKQAVRKLFWVSLIAAFLGVMVFSFHPYITNWTSHGSPFYPLLGDGAFDIMTCNTPSLYLNHNRFENFFLSIYGAVSVTVYDSRISGFGFVFMALFIICVAVLICSEIQRRKFSIIGYMSLLIFLSCFFFEQSWWARYNPQLWMIVPLAYYSILTVKVRGRRLGLCVVRLLGLFSIAEMVISTALFSLSLTVYRNSVYEVLKGKEIKSHVGRLWIPRLRQHGIIPIVVDEDEIPEENRIPILNTPESPIIYNWLEVNPEDRDRINTLYRESFVCECFDFIRDNKRKLIGE